MRKRHKPKMAGIQTRAASQLTAEKINKGGLRRVMEVRSINEQDRTVELAFSSETEVERWFGMEVLSHDPGAMDTSRLLSGGALLVNHDWDDQVGVVESVEIGADKVGRAMVRFSQSARGQEIFQDVKDKIRRNVSVGYSVNAWEVTGQRDDTDIITVTDWTPFEISIVSVPADISVGVGRSAAENVPEETGAGGNNNDTIRNQNNSAENSKQRETASMAEENQQEQRTVDVAAHEKRGAAAEKDRVSSIIEMGEQYKMDDLARAFVKDGKTVAEFQRAALDKLNERTSRPLSEQMQDASVGLNDKEVRQYSFLKIIRALANPGDSKAQKEAAFEMEASRAASDKLGKEAQGILVPADVLARSFTASTAGDAPGHTGGFGVPNTLLSESFIDILRHRATIMKLGFIMGGLVGNFDIPRQSAHGQGYWLGEDQDAGESNIDIDQVPLSAKTVGAYTDITRKLMQQNTIGAELLVRRDLAISLGLTIDTAGYYGTGAATQPLGISGITGIEAVDFGAAGSLPSYANVVDMETAIASADADVEGMVYVGNAKMRGHFKSTLKFPAVNGSATIWEQGNTVNGYRTEITNQIADGDLFFGNFSNLIVGLWGGLDLFVDPYSKSKSGGLRVVAFQDVDFAVRHPQSFCLGRATG